MKCKQKETVNNNIKKLTYSKFADEFNKANEEGRKLYGVIVFSQSNWKKKYTLESRSYATHSDQWGWDYSKMGHCQIGHALDGSETIRMDYYNWRVDYCYLISEEEYKLICNRGALNEMGA